MNGYVAFFHEGPRHGERRVVSGPSWEFVFPLMPDLASLDLMAEKAEMPLPLKRAIYRLHGRGLRGGEHHLHYVFKEERFG